MFERWWAKARDGLTTPEAQKLLADVLQRVDNEIHGRTQSEINRNNGEAVAGLIDSLRDVQSACVVIGSLVVVKYTDHHGEHMLAQELTAAELAVLRRFPDLRRDPRRFFNQLAEGLELLALEAAEENLSQDPPIAMGGGNP